MLINHTSLLQIGIIVFAASLFSSSSSSIFSGLTATTPSFPWNSALAQVDGNDTQDQSELPEQDGEPPTQPPTNDTGGEVEPEPLTAVAQWDSTDGNIAPATFLFEADAEGGAEPYTFHWDFGDGQQATGEFIHHTYENPGTYTAILTVSDATGQTASDTTTSIRVVPATTTEPPPTNGTTPPTTNGTTNQTGGNRSEISNRISVQIQPPGCTSISDAEHWNKIVFRITSDPTGRIDGTLINTELEVLERVNDGGVINVKDIVRYSIVTEPGTLPQLTFDEVEQLEIEILDVEYALICFTS